MEKISKHLLCQFKELDLSNRTEESDDEDPLFPTFRKTDERMIHWSAGS